VCKLSVIVPVLSKLKSWIEPGRRGVEGNRKVAAQRDDEHVPGPDLDSLCSGECHWLSLKSYEYLDWNCPLSPVGPTVPDGGSGGGLAGVTPSLLRIVIPRMGWTVSTRPLGRATCRLTIRFVTQGGSQINRPRCGVLRRRIALGRVRLAFGSYGCGEDALNLALR